MSETMDRLNIANKYLDSVLDKIRQIEKAQRSKTIFYTSMMIYHGIAAIPSAAKGVKNIIKWSTTTIQKYKNMKHGHPKEIAKMLAKAKWSGGVQKVIRPFTALKVKKKGNKLNFR